MQAVLPAIIEPSRLLLVSPAPLDIESPLSRLANTQRSITPVELEAALHERHWDVVVCDFNTPHPTEIVAMVKQAAPHTGLIFVAETATVADAVAMMRLGASGFVDKADTPQLMALVQQELNGNHLSVGRNVTDYDTRCRQLQEAKDELDVYRKQLTGIMDTMQEAVVSLTLPDYRLVYASAAFEQVYGYPFEQFQNDPEFFRQVVHPDDLQLVVEAKQRVYQDHYVEVDHRIIGSDGQVRWLHRRVWINRDEQGRPLCINDSAYDITAHKRAENEGRFHSEILRHMTEGVHIVRAADQTFVYVNPAFERMFGYAPGELIGQHVSILNASTAENPLEVVKRITQSLHKTGRWSGEVQNIRQDGSLFWSSANIIAFDHAEFGLVWISVQQEITAQKQAEAALRASEERYRHIVENQSDLVCRYDTSLHVSYGNAAYCKAFNNTPDAIIGEFILDKIPAELHERIWAYIHSITPENPEAVSTHPSFAEDGSVRWIEWKDRAIVDGQGRIVEFQGVGRDITEQRLTEEALRQSEEHFRYLFKNNPHPMWVYDRETLAFLEVNDSAIDHYGYTRDEFLAMRLTDIRPAEDVARLLEHGEHEHPALQHAGEWRHQLKNGQIIPVEITLHTLEFAGRPAALVVAQDVTERKQAEDALQAAHRLLEQRVVERTEELERAKDRIEAIFNHSGDGIVLVDVKYGVQQANYAFDQMFNRPADSVVGLGLHEFFDPADHSPIVGMVEEVTKTHQTHQIEARAWRLGGTTFDAEISIAPINRSENAVTELVCIIRDITERTQAQAALQKYAAEVRDLYNLAPTGYHSLDLNGVFVRINNTALAWLGYSESEMVGKLKFSDILTPASRQVFYQNFPIFKVQGWVSDLEFEVVRKDGSTFAVMLNATAVYDEKGQFLHSRSTMMDISELKRAQRAVAEERNLLRTVIDAVPDHIYVKDMQHRVVLDNLTHARTLGVHSPAEAVGKRDSEVFPPEMASKFHADEDHLFATGESIINTEERTQGPDGREIWAVTSKVPLRNLNGEVIGLVGTTHDISHLKASEDALRRSQADLLSVIDSTNTMFILVDRAGIVRLVNQRAAVASATMLGQLLVVGQPITAFLPPKFRAIFHKHLAEVLQGQTIVAEFSTAWAGQPLYLEFRYYPVRAVDGEIIGMNIAVDDITERKAAEEILEKKHAQELEMQGYLKALHEITIRLTRAETLDEFFRLAVQEGLAQFGFDRMGLLLYDPRDGSASGTYGTDPAGKLVPEHQLHLDPTSMTGILRHTMDRHERFRLEEDAVLYANLAPIGRGQNAVATLWNGEVLGWLAVDNAVRHQPITQAQLDILALYALTAGSLLSRKRTEDALRESEARYRLLAENIQDVIVRFAPDGLRTYTTPSTYHLLGYTPEELIEDTDILLVHPDDLAMNRARLQEVIQTGLTFYTSTQRLRHKDGHYIWAEVNTTIVRDVHTGEPIELISIVHDITERKHAEDALRQSEQRFRLFIESAPLATVVSDDTGAIVLINEAAEKLLSYQRHELIGQPIEMLVPEPFRAHHANHRALYESLPNARRRHPLELTARRKDGVEIPVDIQLRVIEADPSPMVMSLMIDITERREAEQTLKQALAREKELGDLKSRFVSMASHEFRTPLAAIMATTETLMFYRDKMNTDQIDTRLDKIRQQVNHMKDIMEEVLELARIQAGRVEFKPTLGDLDMLCLEIIEEFDSQATYRGRMAYSCVGAPVTTLFDRRLVRQIISNLISNALKYSGSKPVRIDLRHEAAQVVLVVADEGIGIPANDLKHLFEPFHRASNVGTISGTGLGLSITKQAVDLHTGSIVPESIEGVGTTFIVTLPKLDQGS